MLTRDKLLNMYRQLVLIRYFDSELLRYWDEGLLIGTGHASIGEEGVGVGACAALEERDYIISTHRAHGQVLARGADPKVIMAELFGKATGCTGGKGGSMHISDFDRYILGTNGIVGGGLTIAGGVGLALKMMKTRQVCVCFFGDGAASRGVFHETLNLASLRKVNTVFVCSNNQYALSTPIVREAANTDISARAIGYNIPGVRVDGTDVMAVYEVVKTAVERARDGGGPSLIECVVYRLRGHNVLEPRRPQYQPTEEKEEWNRSKDPLPIFKKMLIDQDYMTPEIAVTLENEAKQKIEEAYQFAKNSPEPGAESLFTNMYA